MGSTSFLGFSCPNLLFIFLDIHVTFRNLLHNFFASVIGLLWVLIFFFLYLILG